MVRSWSGLPIGKVIRLEDADAGALALALDPLPDDAPAVLTYTAPESRSPAALAASILDELDAAALRLFPAWLPGAEGIDGPGGANLPAVRTLALRTAAGTSHFGPFLAELAERALRPRASGFPPEIRAAGLGRVLADAFSRHAAAILVDVPEELSAVGQATLVAAGEWLAHRAGLGIWLAGPLPAVDRVETIPPPRPALPSEEPAQGTRGVPPETPRTSGTARVAAAGGTLHYPPVAGKPHPGSDAERALEAALGSSGWAAGRAWNQTLRTTTLASPVRVDLLWQAERCVVEVDGPDHRREPKFTDDRARDVRLHLAGYAVLRFTDVQVLTDSQAVVRSIELFLRNRRSPRKG